MRILYSAGPRVGADLLLSRFLSGCQHEVRVAAYDISSRSVPHVDWTLDAIYNKYTGANRIKLVNLFGKKDLPMMGYEQVLNLIKEVDAYQPDLIICDYEPIMSNVAAVMGIPLWYSSPVHLLDGVKWKNGQMRYTGLLEVTRKNLKKLPKAERTYVWSPFALIEGIDLKEGYQWLMPEFQAMGLHRSGSGVCLINDPNRLSELSKIMNCIPPYDLVMYSTHRYSLSHLESYLLTDSGYQTAVGGANWMFCGGESVFLGDGLWNDVYRFCVSPDLDDPEALLNAILVRAYGLGEDLGQVEFLEYFSVEEIQKSYEKRFRMEYQPRNFSGATLNMEINNYARSL